MARTRFRWTRERYYRAQHLDRLLPQLTSTTSPPSLVVRLHELIRQNPGMWNRDPLDRPLWLRHHERFGDPDIPF